MLKQKLENEKNKEVKPEPNPDTGEVAFNSWCSKINYFKR